MENLKEDIVLKFRSDTLIAVRKDVNLDKPGRLDEAIDILENWVEMQPHFLKKTFNYRSVGYLKKTVIPLVVNGLQKQMTQRKLIRVFRPLTSFMQEMAREYLERTLISTKGLVERAKERLDRLCTFRTMMPQYFNVSNVKEEFTPFTKFLLTSYFRNLTPNHYRVFLNKVVTDVNLESSILTAFYKYMIMVSEYLKNADYCNGFVLIFDYSDANILNLVSKFNPMELKQVTALFTEGYGLRIKGVHIISASRMVETILGLFKQVFSAKVAGRIHIHKTMETVFEFVPKKIFPADYGGDEKYLKDLQAEWFDVLSSKEFMDYYLTMKEAKTDESYREVNEFNEDYIGIPGSFRALNVD